MTGIADEPSRARNLHALSGVLPVGAFLVLHLLTNARALAGQEAFVRAGEFWERLPLSALGEIVLVLVPLAFHAGYGALLLVRKADGASPYPQAWRPIVRGSAWVTLAFILYHAYALGLPRWTHAVAASSAHTVLVAHLSRATGSAEGLLLPWTAFVYLVGLAATTLHFAIGTWGYLVRSGRASTTGAQRTLARGLAAAGLALFALSAMTVISLASGSPLFPAAPDSPPCPAPAPAPAVPRPPSSSS